MVDADAKSCQETQLQAKQEKVAAEAKAEHQKDKDCSREVKCCLKVRFLTLIKLI